MTSIEPPADATSTAIQRAAARLEEAARTGVPCRPIRDLIGVDDILLAYSVQERLKHKRMLRGSRVVGRKIGLTSRAVQRQLGVDQPDFGVLFDDMDVSELPCVPYDRLLQPRVEAEVAFVLSHDVASHVVDTADLQGCIDYALPALEIVDSRVTSWDVAITDTVADNASSGLYVLGEKRVSISDFEPRDVRMHLMVDDVVVSEGDGTACLGDPLLALQWLANTALAFGEPLAAGQLVLSGALSTLAPVQPGSVVRAEFTTLGHVAATFSSKEAR